MTSILTNIAAMSALQTLRTIGSSMEDTQARVSSGLRVGNASDNAAYWSIATTMRSDNGALSAVQDAMGLGAAKVDTAYAGMESSIDVIKEIKNKLVAAREPGVDKAKIQAEITQLQDQLKSISSSSSFSGENWLNSKISDGAGNLTDVTKQIVGSFTRDASGNVSVKTINVALSNSTVLFDASSGLAEDKQGILDSYAYYSTSGAYKLFDITAGATAATATKASVAAQVFSEAQLRSSALDATATTDFEVYANGLVAVKNASADPTAATGTYFKIGDDQYVKIRSATDGAPATTDGPTAPVVETSIGSVGGVAVYLDASTEGEGVAYQLEYSMTSLDITKDLVGPTGVTLTAEQALDAMISFVDKQLETATSAAADLGSVKMRIDLQEDFISKLSDSIDSGIGRLVDAEMNEESTRLKALQTQQQLGVQALSIANSSSESILSLFR